MQARPKFRPDIQASEQNEGGEKFVLLKDPVTEQYYRVTPFEYRLLKALDGRVTLEEALEALKNLGYYYSPEDARLIVAKAAEYGLLLGTRFGTAEFQRHLRDRIMKAKKERVLASLYFMFIPILNPDRFLERTLWFYRKLVNKWTAIAAGVLALGAVVLIIAGSSHIETEFLFFFNLENLVYLWVTIAITKLVHEFAHAYSAKSYGLHVPQMGIAFLIFFPCLYCNTTDAWQLADRKQRMAISAAGIVAEGMVAVLSAYVWYFTRPGVINSLAFYLMAVSFVSTALFNGNPLLKWDGYFILMDYLRVPNLATKSLSYLKYLFMNRVLGISLIANPAANPREVFIFTTYGISAFLYRIFLYTAIVVGLYYRFDKLLAVLLAFLAIVVFGMRPLVKGIGSIYQKRAEVHPRPAGAVVFALILAVGIGILCFPISTKSVYPCFLDSAKIQKLTVPLKTAVKDVLIRDGMAVQEGSLLFTLDTSPLKLTLRKKEIEREIIKEKIKQALLDDKKMARSRELLIQLSQIGHEIDILRVDFHRAQGGITAPFSGVVIRMDHRLQDGFQPGDGSIVGELKSQGDRVVRILIPEKDMEKVREGQRVEVWFPTPRGVLYSGAITEIKSYNESDLADSPFSSRFGGEIATEARDSKRLDIPLEAQYVCSANFSGNAAMPLGVTGRCAIGSPPQSILSRAFSAAIQTFNRESLL
ncbi:MAG: site-2 protease family protein [Thermodesulfobacteriota bacterium]